MTLWVTRTGRYGTHEQRFLDTSRLYLTWDGFRVDLATKKSKDEVLQELRAHYPDAPEGRQQNHAAQIWAFAKKMERGDWVVVPSKQKPAIHVGEIVGKYEFDTSAEDPYFHSRTLKWIAKDIPRSVFDQDLLYSFGAVQTIFEVSRNDAEARVRAMEKMGWTHSELPSSGQEVQLPAEEEVDLEETARDQIAKLIIRKFKGHDLERLVEGVLIAQGYTTYRSPIGPDKGIDILAAPGPLGFGQPRICVQVKSGDGPIDSQTLNQLIGSMQNVQANQGLLVAWGGFKSSVDKEIPVQFFKVRLWDSADLINQILTHYDALNADLRAELPLKQVWMVSREAEPS